MFDDFGAGIEAIIVFVIIIPYKFIKSKIVGD